LGRSREHPWEEFKAFSQYSELSDGGYEQLSLAESCVNFCGFDLHLCENAIVTQERVSQALALWPTISQGFALVDGRELPCFDENR
jgi:hypothetical protein